MDFIFRYIVEKTSKRDKLTPRRPAIGSLGFVVRLRILVVGAGTVGRATGFGFASKGNQVSFFDPDPSVRARLEGHGYTVLSVFPDDLNEIDVVMVAVPTPTTNGRLDHTPILNASIQIGIGLKGCSDYKLVCVRSTVLPSTTRNIVVPALESASQKRTGVDFGVCFNPEFLRESSAYEDFLQPDRIVVGELDERSGRMLETMYEPLQRPVVRCRLEEAELAKYAANGFLATKISYFNEVAGFCQKFGADPKIVNLIVSMDKRIGDYGTVGGTPYGGKCLPKDVDALLGKARDTGEHLEVLEAAARINKRMEELLQTQRRVELSQSSVVQDAK